MLPDDCRTAKNACLYESSVEFRIAWRISVIRASSDMTILQKRLYQRDERLIGGLNSLTKKLMDYSGISVSICLNAVTVGKRSS